VVTARVERAHPDGALDMEARSQIISLASWASTIPEYCKCGPVRMLDAWADIVPGLQHIS
jgi:hypothetical protein